MYDKIHYKLKKKKKNGLVVCKLYLKAVTKGKGEIVTSPNY